MRVVWFLAVLSLVFLCGICGAGQGDAALRLTTCGGKTVDVSTPFEGVGIQWQDGHIKSPWEKIKKIEFSCKVKPGQMNHPARIYFQDGKTREMVIEWMYGNGKQSYILESETGDGVFIIPFERIKEIVVKP
jgi:hypothetical protein